MGCQHDNRYSSVSFVDVGNMLNEKSVERVELNLICLYKFNLIEIYNLNSVDR